MHEGLKQQKIESLWAVVNDAHGKHDDGDIDTDDAFALMSTAVDEFCAPPTIEARTEKCAKQVEHAMDGALVEWFPECESGDVDPTMVMALHVALRDFVKRWNEINQESPIASVDADAWRDGDVTCPNCDDSAAPVTDTLYGGRVTRLRCSNCSYTQGEID